MPFRATISCSLHTSGQQDTGYGHHSSHDSKSTIVYGTAGADDYAIKLVEFAPGPYGSGSGEPSTDIDKVVECIRYTVYQHLLEVDDVPGVTERTIRADDATT